MRTQKTEYMTTPRDSDGDSLDQAYWDTLSQAREHAPHHLAQYPAAVLVDIEKIKRVWMDGDLIAEDISDVEIFAK